MTLKEVLDALPPWQENELVGYRPGKAKLLNKVVNTIQRKNLKHDDKYLDYKVNRIYSSLNAEMSKATIVIVLELKKEINNKIKGE